MSRFKQSVSASGSYFESKTSIGDHLKVASEPRVGLLFFLFLDFVYCLYWLIFSFFTSCSDVILNLTESRCLEKNTYCMVTSSGGEAHNIPQNSGPQSAHPLGATSPSYSHNTNNNINQSHPTRTSNGWDAVHHSFSPQRHLLFCIIIL